MANILVVADVEGNDLRASTRAAVDAASRIGGTIDVLVAGSEGAAEAASNLAGVSRILAAPAAASSEALASQAAAAAGPYTHILFAMGNANRAAMPRAAALLGVSPLSEISEVVDPRTFKRSMYAGGVIATIRTPEGARVVATVRTTSFESAPLGGVVPVVPVEGVPAFAGNELVAVNVAKSDRPDLLTAKRVVSGGQGLEDEEGFRTLEAFADKIGAAVGATRVVVDAGLCPNEWQVGQTGKIVAPELYIAFGISGAIQHLSGMMGSKVIVAVNKDPEAPIFEVCDYGLVADAKSTAAELAKAL